MTEWLLAPLVAAVIVNTLAAALALWARWRWADDADVGPSAVEDGRVVCQECGADNEAGYRFCRHCVAELPGPSLYTPSGGRSQSSYPL